MNERHDPLNTCSDTDLADPPALTPKKPRQKKSALLRELIKVPPETLLFLYTNQVGTAPPDLPSRFTAYCEANGHFSTWLTGSKIPDSSWRPTWRWAVPSTAWES